jgi:26S proteasome regulatory subunit N8
MMRRINGRGKIIGWFHTGPDTKKSDTQINEIFRRRDTSPAYFVIRVSDETNISLLPEAYLP